MKIKKGYLLHEVANNFVIIAIGQESINFNGLMTVSESGKVLWELLNRPQGAEKEELIEALLAVYEVEREVVEKDVEEFLASLSKNGLVE